KEIKMITVVGAVIVENDKILCAQRAAGASLPHKRANPAGKIEANETPEEALRRENEEEMSCRIQVSERDEPIDPAYDFGTVHLTTFYCQIIAGIPRRTEHASIKWLSPFELATLDWAPADLPTVKRIEKDFR